MIIGSPACADGVIKGIAACGRNTEAFLDQPAYRDRIIAG